MVPWVSTGLDVDSCEKNRNDLRAAQTKLEQAAANVEQYQSISITQGESLNELHTTYDEYKIATDRTIAEKDVSDFQILPFSAADPSATMTGRDL